MSTGTYMLITGAIAATAVVGVSYTLSKLADERHRVLAIDGKPALEIPIDYNTHSHIFRTSSGLILSVHRWLIPNPTGIVYLVHGFREYCNRYDSIAYYFNSLGYNVVGIDHQGHGGSQGDRAYTMSFKHYTSDYIEYMQHELTLIQSHITPYASNTPFYISNDTLHNNIINNVVILGHSMGGLVSCLITQYLSSSHDILSKHIPLLSTAQYPPRLVLSAPALALDKSVTDSPILLSLTHFLSTFMPKLPISSLPFKSLSTDPIIDYIVKHDPIFAPNTLKARFAREFLDGISTAQCNAQHHKWHTLLFHSPSDNLVDIIGSREYITKTPTGIIDMIECKGNHEVLSDMDRTTIFSQIKAWLQQPRSS